MLRPPPVNADAWRNMLPKSVMCEVFQPPGVVVNDWLNADGASTSYASNISATSVTANVSQFEMLALNDVASLKARANEVVPVRSGASVAVAFEVCRAVEVVATVAEIQSTPVRDVNQFQPVATIGEPESFDGPDDCHRVGTTGAA